MDKQPSIMCKPQPSRNPYFVPPKENVGQQNEVNALVQQRSLYAAKQQEPRYRRQRYRGVPNGTAHKHHVPQITQSSFGHPCSLKSDDVGNKVQPVAEAQQPAANTPYILFDSNGSLQPYIFMLALRGIQGEMGGDDWNVKLGEHTYMGIMGRVYYFGTQAFHPLSPYISKETFLATVEPWKKYVPAPQALTIVSEIPTDNAIGTAVEQPSRPTLPVSKQPGISVQDSMDGIDTAVQHSEETLVTPSVSSNDVEDGEQILADIAQQSISAQPHADESQPLVSDDNNSDAIGATEKPNVYSWAGVQVQVTSRGVKVLSVKPAVGIMLAVGAISAVGVAFLRRRR